MPLELIEPEAPLYAPNLLNEVDDLVRHAMARLRCLLVVALDNLEQLIEAARVLFMPALGRLSNLIELAFDASVAIHADALVLFTRQRLTHALLHSDDDADDQEGESSY